MHSYQHGQSKMEAATTPIERRTERSAIGKSLRRITGTGCLGVGIACLLVAAISSMPHGYHRMMETIPIEMEGNPLRRMEKATDHAALEEGCEANIILMRHCEKGNLKKHCDYIGLERSVYLASLFGDKDERWPTPALIFAESPDGRHSSHKRNYREIETAGPLSQKTGVDVDASYNTETERDLVHHIGGLLKRGELCGKVVVIVWKHSRIGHLARRLGCGHDQGCPTDYRGKFFDETWQLRFVYDFMVAPNAEYHHHQRPPLWQVFGSVQEEKFDPLAFSKKKGDFPAGGRMGPPHWLPEADVLSDETVTKAGDNWDEIKPEFVA